METIFVIKSKDNRPVIAAWDEGTAKQKAKELNAINGEGYFTYTEIPLYFEPGTQFNVIAPPIPKDYLPSSERTLMGDFKADAS